MSLLTPATRLGSVALMLVVLSACGPSIQSYEAASLLNHSEELSEEVELAPGEELEPGQTFNERVVALTSLPAASKSTTIWVDDDGVQATKWALTGVIKNSSTKSGIMLAVEKAKTIAEGNVIIRVLPGSYPGQIYIQRDNVSLIAMKDKWNEINPSANLASTKSLTDANWSVRISSSGDAITANGGRKNIVVRGFYITKAAKNGIHFYGSLPEVNTTALPYKFASLCSNIAIEGNRIENIMMDGVKVHQCHKILVQGNLIKNTSLVASKEKEHAIDFVAVGNSVIRENNVLANAIGMTAKGGSIKITIEKNEFTGPFQWRGITVGEGTLPEYAYYSSRRQYQSKRILIRNNTIRSGIYMLSCQSCSAITNTITSSDVVVQQRDDKGEKSSGICISSSGTITNTVAGLTVSKSNCPTSFADGTIVNVGGDTGYDMR